MNRTELRQMLRYRRQQLSPVTRAEYSVAIYTRIKALALIQPKQKVALYTMCGSEVDIMPLVQYANVQRADIYLPLLPKTGRMMAFTALSKQGYWQTNQFGIKEWISAVTVPPEALDLVFMPLLGFDIQGNRLGQGGGYYDASFAFLPQLYSAKPLLFGVAFDCQRIDNIVTEAWDVPLHGVITERAYYGKSIAF